MVLMKFQRPAFYVRKDPDAGWIVSIAKFNGSQRDDQ